MEHLRTRKLLPLLLDHEPAAAPVSQSGISSNTSSAFLDHPNPSFNVSHRNEHRTHEDYSYYSGGSTSSSYGGFSSYRLNPPFDSSMAVTILVLLTALFSMGFFSIYIRRFADDSSVDPSRFRRFRRRSASRPPNLSSYPGRSAAKGVDPETVDALPVYRYDGGAKPEMECAICLSEFEVGECVKVIPFCGHVFHADCIVMWLASHVTCPLCRTAKFFPEEAAEKEGGGAAPPEVRVSIGCDAGGAESVEGSTSTVDGRDTCTEGNGGAGRSRLGRSGSCPGISVERATLRRSMSF